MTGRPAVARESLRRAFSWNLVGTAVYAASQWGMLSVLARIGDRQRAETDLGIFVFGLAVAAPLVLLFSMQTRTLLAADAGGRYPYRTYVAQRAVCMLAAFVLAMLWGFVDAPEMVLVITLVAGARAAEGLSDVAHGQFQRAHRMWRVALSQVVRGLGGLAALGLGAWLGGSLVVGCAGLFAYWVLVALAFDLPAAARIGDGTSKRPDLWPAVRALTMEAAPLGVVSGVVSLTSNLPRYLIEDAAGPRLLGVFAALAYAMVAIALVVQSLSAAAIPRMGKAFVDRDFVTLRRITARACGVASVPGIVAIPICALWGDWLMAILYRPEFAEFGHLLWWFCLLGVLSAVAGMLRSVMTACGALRPQFPISVVTAILTGVGTWYMLPRGALWAGVVGLLAGRLFQLAAHAWYAARVVSGPTAPASE